MIYYITSGVRFYCITPKVLLLYNGNDYQTNLDIISAKDGRAAQAVDDLYAICQSDENLHTSVIDHLCGKVGG